MFAVSKVIAGRGDVCIFGLVCVVGKMGGDCTSVPTTNGTRSCNGSWASAFTGRKLITMIQFPSLVNGMVTTKLGESVVGFRSG